MEFREVSAVLFMFFLPSFLSKFPDSSIKRLWMELGRFCNRFMYLYGLTNEACCCCIKKVPGRYTTTGKNMMQI